MNLSGVYKSFLERWDGLQTCWIISDTHFGDKDLKQGIHNHPSDEELVKNINAKCGKTDLLIHLGDVGDTSYIARSRAKRKILIMGNHDAGRSNYERFKKIEIFDADKYTRNEALAEIQHLYPNCRYSIDMIYSFHAPFEAWQVIVDNCLFDEVYEGPVMVGEKLILSHEPLDIPWAFNIHGHDHAGAKRKNHLNVCADVIGYTPVNMNQFMKSGALSHVETIHRQTIDIADAHAKKRGYKLGQNKK